MSRLYAVNHDVPETRIPPIDARGFAVKYVLCGRVIGQDTEVLEKNFIDSWFFGW